MDAPALIAGSSLERTVRPTRGSVARVPAAVPRVIGVTGHRDLRPADRPALDVAVRSAFDAAQATDPDRPLVLVTPLAEGADTLVAEIALDLGAWLVVVLPFSRAVYEQDFTAEARATFDRLFNHDRVVRRIELPPAPVPEGIDAGTRRSLQYALVGAFVARHSDVLLALWDGRPSDSIGGTAQVVQYRRAGVFPIERTLLECMAAVPDPFGVQDSPLDAPEVGPLYHIITPRLGSPEPDRAFARDLLLPFAYSEPEPDPKARDKYVERLQDIDVHIRDFNRDARALELRVQDGIERSALKLDAASDSAALPPGLQALRWSFALADRLALRQQRALHRVLLLLFGLIFVAALAFALFAHGFREGQVASRTMIGLYAGVLALADAIFVAVKLRRWQDKYQDYRAVAEGLRVQFYWRVAGLSNSASDHYVRQQRDDLSWISHAVRACGLVAPPLLQHRLSLVQSGWVDGQATYYNAARAQSQRSLLWSRAGSGAIAVSILIGLRVLKAKSDASRVPLLVLVLAIAVFLAHALLESRELVRGEHGSTDRASRLWDAAARIAGFVIGLGIWWLLVQVPRWISNAPEWSAKSSDDWQLIALGTTTVVGALLHGYAEIRAFAEHARRYGRMAAVFRRANERLRAMISANDDHGAQRLVIELGKEALADHGDWVMLHRERPIELPEASG